MHEEETSLMGCRSQGGDTLSLFEGSASVVTIAPIGISGLGPQPSMVGLALRCYGKHRVEPYTQQQCKR